ncbi:hypothetical protein [Phytomonospora endophytica]|uniref:DUF3558 domain-containing protein n=1 Tax=Phytomonospora endophytica TaxID=714109 RepID=A0A841FC16_9ACTN|nr:hypothetical protein [Phytomonospora endophytica]MBB6034831.1 hypothetical protein [Phytomonospora endophytica]GIG68965.1 hypothetical protein Pen01_52600 [Phytomonospora endophytica]
MSTKRLHRVLGACALLLALSTAAACGGGEGGGEPEAAGSSSAPVGIESEPDPSGAPEEEKGTEDDAKGACEYLDVAAVAEAVGVDFTVVEPAEAKNAQVCVLQTTKGSYPDLTLATAKTKADPASFKATMMPDSAEEVGKLGKSAYQVVLKAPKGGGPVAEIGWLSDDDRLFTLRYTSEAGTKKDTVAKTLKPLVALAKAIEKAAK